MLRQYQVIQHKLLRTFVQHPQLPMLVSIAFSVTAVATAVVGAGRSRIANAVAVVLVLIGAGLSVLGSRMSSSRRLGPEQRLILLQALGRVTPIEVRVSAVDERDSIRYARELRNVMTEARWPVTGVFKHESPHDATGVTLAVRNVVAPPEQAIVLMNTLRRIGVPVTWEHRPELTGDHVVEVLVGRLR
jgi:hypothetical protein